MARWTIVVASIAAALFLTAAVFMFRSATALPMRLAASFFALFGVLGLLDTLFSRIVLRPHELVIISLVRRRRFPRDQFASAKVEAGSVCLERRDGGWLVLPSTGHNALGIRNTVHSWIRASTVALCSSGTGRFPGEQ